MALFVVYRESVGLLWAATFMIVPMLLMMAYILHAAGGEKYAIYTSTSRALSL